DLGALDMSLKAEGHEVRVAVSHPLAQGTLAGLIDKTPDWRSELPWIREAGDDGIILFESVSDGFGALQDELRRDGFRVIGGSAYGDRLEADREFGQQVLRGFGLPTAATHGFTSYAAAIDFLQRRGGRYVLKFNGADSPRTRNYIGEMDDAADMLALLAMYEAHHAAAGPPDFVLMQHVQGIEVGVGAYFNGEAFLSPACIDFEHKRFFPGDLGELTGEMGTIVSYRGAEKIFDASLARVAPLLRQSGYCGYINLNLIANDEGLWPLEFTSRFGYPGFAICEALHDEPWEALFRRMLRRDGLGLATRSGFAAGVVLTVPPFPYSEGYETLSKGEPICFQPGLATADRAGLHFAEVARLGGHLVTSGTTGYVGVATGTGASVQAASDAAYRLARQVVVPNLRYRTDIGDRVRLHDLARLEALGWL
ncbi:MAG: phosphoribosylglycinamide synthetase, partial [Polaromonas sp.]|nr:phosphoribosylglycinamide synthetase [Polaromonas sp.]